jgi:hypothetical protein
LVVSFVIWLAVDWGVEEEEAGWVLVVQELDTTFCTDVEPDSECFERSSATGNVVAVTTPLCRAALVTTGVLITTDPLPRPLELGTLATEAVPVILDGRDDVESCMAV